MEIVDKIIDFIFGYDTMYDIIKWDFERSYDCNIEFEDLMIKYHNEIEQEKGLVNNK